MPFPTLSALFQQARNQGATDVFLTEGGRPRLKLNGAVTELETSPVTREEMAAFWTHCGADPAETQDLDTSYAAASDYRLRVSLFRHCGLLGAALRPIKHQIPTLDSLGLPEHVLLPWLQRRSGLILVTGATGSGKSTTIASCLEWLNAHFQKHVVTIEDPIEYLFTSRYCLFSQREVGTDTVSFARGLRGALRQAPDIIFVGEIRDAETATIALQACETGHLVMATLHSADTVDTFERLNSIFPASERVGLQLLLSNQLIGILSQLLLPAAGGGLTLVTEHLENTGAIRPWIRAEKLPDIRDYIQREQSTVAKSFLRSLVEAVEQGRINADVAQNASSQPTDFLRALKGLS